MLPPDDLTTRHTLLRQLADLHNEAAWHAFVERYQPLIEHWCRFRLRPQDAEDVTARILGKLVKRMADGSYDTTRGGFRKWLRVGVENEAHDFCRGRRRRPDLGGSKRGGLADWPDPTSIQELTDELDDRIRADLLLAEEIATEVRHKVTPTTWAAFWQTRCLGQSSGEAARQLGMTATAVSQARYRVGKMLRSLWKQRQRIPAT